MTIYGVSFDSVEENRAFAEKFGFDFRLLCDVERQLGLAYGACDAKTDGFARRISYLIGPDGAVAHVFGEVSPKTHAAEVLSAVRAAKQRSA